MVATGINEAGETGTWVVDADGNDWIGRGNESAPVDWQLALEIWKGRKLLTNFNPTFS